MNEFGIGFLFPTPRSCIDLIALWNAAVRLDCDGIDRGFLGKP